MPFRTAFAAWIVAFAAVAWHVVGLWNRVSDELLLEPDSTEYVVGAYAISQGRGFADLSSPSQWPIAVRQPGTGYLLAPVTAWRGFDVPACKRVLLLVGSLAILAWAALAAWWSGSAWAGAGVAVVLAAAPALALCHVEIMSEPLFDFATALFLLALTFAEGRGRAGCVAWGGAAGVALFAAIVTRTQGLALLPAVLVWVGPTRDRRRWLVAGAALATLAGGWLALRGWTNPLTSYFALRQDNAGGADLGRMWWGTQRTLADLGTLLAPPYWPLLPERGVGRPALDAWWSRGVGALAGLVLLAGLVRTFLRTDRPAVRAALVALALQLALVAGWSVMDRLLMPALTLATAALCSCNCRWTRGLAWWIIAVHVAWLAALLGGRLAVPLPKPLPSAELEAFVRTTLEPHETVLSDRSASFLGTARFTRMFAVHGGDRLDGDGLLTLIGGTGARHALLSATALDARLRRNAAVRAVPLRPDGDLKNVLRFEPNRTGVADPAPPRTVVEDTALARATADYETGRKAEARARLELLLAERPDDERAPDARLLLGAIALDRDDLTAADAHYAAAGQGANYFVYGAAAASGRKVAAARRQASDPKEPIHVRAALWLALSDSEAAYCHWEAAVRPLDQALATLPPAGPLLVRRAELHRILGQPQEAAADLAAAFKLLPAERGGEWRARAVDLAVLLAAPAALARNAPTTIDVGGQPLALDPNDPEAFRSCANIAARRNLWGMAFAFLEAGHRRRPDHEATRRQFARACERFGMLKEADELLAGLAAPQPADRETRRRIQDARALRPLHPRTPR